MTDAEKVLLSPPLFFLKQKVSEMPENFTPVTLSRASDYYALWEKLPVHSLDYSLVNLWGWQEYYGLEWSFEDGLCWICLLYTSPSPRDRG